MVIFFVFSGELKDFMASLLPEKMPDFPEKKEHIKAQTQKTYLPLMCCCFCTASEMQDFHLTTGLFLFVQVQYNMTISC